MDKLKSNANTPKQPVPVPEGQAMARIHRNLMFLVAGFVFVSACVTIAMLFFLRDQSLRSGQSQTEAFAQVIAEQTARTLQVTEQGLLLALHGLRALSDDGKLSIQAAAEIFARKTEAMTFITAMWVLDANGNITYASEPKAVGMNLADRDYFQYLRTQPLSRLYVGPAIQNRIKGNWMFAMALPILSPQGEFSGVIVAGVDIDYVDKLWANINLGLGGSISLLNQDGVLLMRSPFSPSSVGESRADSPIFKESISNNMMGSFQEVSSIDGVHRLFAFQALPTNQNLLVIVGQDLNFILRHWHYYMYVAAAFWVLLGLVIYFLALSLSMSMHLTAKEETRTQQMAERLTLATSAATVAVWDRNLRTGERFCTETYFTLLGITPVEGIVDYQGWLALIHPEDREFVKRQGAMVNTSDTYEYQARVKYGDGSFRWLHVNGRVVERDSQGNALRMLGIMRDVSDEKLHSEALQKNEALIRGILDSVDSEIAVVNPDGVIALVNAPWSRFALENGTEPGKPAPGTGVGANYLDVCRDAHGHSSNRAFDACEGIRSVLEGTKTRFSIEYTCHSPSEERWFNMAVTPFGEGGMGVVVVHTDISERIRMESELRMAGFQYRTAVETSFDGYWMVDLAGNILEVNKAYELLSSYAREELLHMRVTDFDAGFDLNAMAEQRALIIKEGHARFQTTHKRKDGSLWPVQVAVTYTAESGGRFFFFLSDQSERFEAEARLREYSLQLHALSQRVLNAQETERRRIAIELHDELGQALTAIKINLQSAERFGEQPPAELNKINIHIIEDALKQVRQMALALRPSILDDLGLGSALRWLGEQTVKRSGIPVVVQLDMPEVRLDPEIETAFFRIAQEALTNVVRHAQAKQVNVGLRLDGVKLLMNIRDDGCGFDPKEMELRSLAGRSLGLLGMQERATLIGGTLQIESKAGLGSQVCLSCTAHVREGVT